MNIGGSYQAQLQHRRSRRKEINSLESQMSYVHSKLGNHLRKYPATAGECNLSIKKEPADMVGIAEENKASQQPHDMYDPIEDDVLVEMECVRKKQQLPPFNGDLQIELECVPIGKWNNIKNSDDDLQVDMECIRRIVNNTGNDIHVEMECIRIQSEKKNTLKPMNANTTQQYKQSAGTPNKKPVVAPPLKITTVSDNSVRQSNQSPSLHINLQKNTYSSRISAVGLLPPGPSLMKHAPQGINMNTAYTASLVSRHEVLPSNLLSVSTSALSPTPLNVSPSTSSTQVHSQPTELRSQQSYAAGDSTQKNQQKSQSRTSICPFCDKKFASFSNMRRHSLNVHKQTLPPGSSSKYGALAQQNLSTTGNTNDRTLPLTYSVANADNISDTVDTSCEMIYESTDVDFDNSIESKSNDPPFVPATGSLNNIKPSTELTSAGDSVFGLQLMSDATTSVSSSPKPKGFEKDVIYYLTSSDDDTIDYDINPSNVSDTCNERSPSVVGTVYNLCPTTVSGLYNLCPTGEQEIPNINPNSNDVQSSHKGDTVDHELNPSNINEICKETYPTETCTFTEISAGTVYNLRPTTVNGVYDLCPAGVEEIEPQSNPNSNDVQSSHTDENPVEKQRLEDQIYTVCPVSELEVTPCSPTPNENVSHLLGNEASVIETSSDEDAQYPTLVTLLGDDNILSQTLDVLLSSDTFLNPTWCYNPSNVSFFKELNSCLESIEQNHNALPNSVTMSQSSNDDVEK